MPMWYCGRLHWAVSVVLWAPQQFGGTRDTTVYWGLLWTWTFSMWDIVALSRAAADGSW